MQKLLSKRILRDLKSNFFRYFSLFFLIVLGMFMIISIVGSAESIIWGVERSNEETLLEDGEFSVFVPLSAQELKKLNDTGATVCENFYLDFPVENTVLRVYEERKNTNLFVLTKGRSLLGQGEILLEQHYAEAHNIMLSDTLTIGSMSYTVVGLGSTPDYDAVFEKVSDTSVDSDLFGTAFVQANDYAQLLALGQSIKTEEYCYSYLLNGKISDAELKEIIQSFELDRSQVQDHFFLEMLDEIESTKNDIQDGIRELLDGSEELSDGLFEITDNNAELNDAAKELFDSMLEQINDSLEESDIDVVLQADTYEQQIDKMLQNPAAYSSKIKDNLLEAKKSLKSFTEFQNGIKEYTYAVQEAADGSLELTDGIEELQDKANEMLEEYFTYDLDNLTSFITRENNPRIKASINDVLINKYVGMVAGMILMFLFTYVISVFVVHSIEQESSVIGALYAVGVTKRQLLFHYLVMPVCVTLVGGVVGCLLGFSKFGIGWQMQDSIAYFSMPPLEIVCPGYLLLYGLAMPPLAAVIVNLLVISKKLNRTALSLMRNEQPANHANKIRTLNLGHLSFLPRFQIRQQLRELRSGITLIGAMFVCLLILMLAVNCYVLCNNYQLAAANDTKYEYLYSYKYPTKEVPKGGTEGYMESLNKEAYGYDVEMNILGLTEDNPYYDIRVSDKMNELVLSSAAASKFSVDVGDKLVLSDEINERDYAFTVTEIIPYSSALYGFMDIDTMRELFGQEEDYYNVVFANKELAIETGRLYASMSRANIEQSAQVFIQMMKPMFVMMTVLSALIFMIVMYLMMKVMVDRSSFSISLMKVLGYRKWEIKKLYLDGNLLIVAVGSLIGVPLSKWLMDALYPYFVSNIAIGLDLTFSWKIYLAIFAGIFLCYLVINTLLVHRLNHVLPAEVLKNRE